METEIEQAVANNVCWQQGSNHQWEGDAIVSQSQLRALVNLVEQYAPPGAVRELIEEEFS